MKTFKEMGIQVASRAFIGDKIKIERLLNRQIIIHHFKIADSNKREGTKCLHLQVEIDGQMRVNFTSASALMEAIQKVPQENFPFTTTIVKDNDRFEFS